MEDSLYDGHDLETGLHDSFYFSDELDGVKSLLGRSGGSHELAVLRLPDDTSAEKVKEIVEYWKEQFVRVCRYDKMEGYVFLGLQEDVDVEEVQEAVRDKLSNTDVIVSKIRIHANSPSLDELAKQF